MSWFTSKAASTPSEPTNEGGSRHGVGAEQDRYASHFGVGDSAKESIKEGVREFANQKGSGAEQDRYASHFSLSEDPVRRAATWLANQQEGASGAEQDRYGGWFGLGHDGWARARSLAEGKGVGAEQVCVVF